MNILFRTDTTVTQLIWMWKLVSLNHMPIIVISYLINIVLSKDTNNPEIVITTIQAGMCHSQQIPNWFIWLDCEYECHSILARHYLSHISLLCCQVKILKTCKWFTTYTDMHILFWNDITVVHRICMWILVYVQNVRISTHKCIVSGTFNCMLKVLVSYCFT
jgi:hypothetical protein